MSNNCHMNNAACKTRSAKQPNRERCQPVRIISDPLRFEASFVSVIAFLAASSFALSARVALLLLGLLFGIWGGQNFYRERFLIGCRAYRVRLAVWLVCFGVLDLV